MPLGPGADLFEVVARAALISSADIGAKGRGGSGSGSSGWEGRTGKRFAEKKRGMLVP